MWWQRALFVTRASVARGVATWHRAKLGGTQLRLLRYVTHTVSAPSLSHTDHVRCHCQMLGMGVYFAEHEKAVQFARRRAAWDDEEGKRVGAVLHCRIDLGYCKHAQRKPCPCGCGKPFVDHPGAWYSSEGYDSLFVPNNSMPATRVAEWCVADAARITIEQLEIVA